MSEESNPTAAAKVHLEKLMKEAKIAAQAMMEALKDVPVSPIAKMSGTIAAAVTYAQEVLQSLPNDDMRTLVGMNIANQFLKTGEVIALLATGGPDGEGNSGASSEEGGPTLSKSNPSSTRS